MLFAAFSSLSILVGRPVAHAPYHAVPQPSMMLGLADNIFDASALTSSAEAALAAATAAVQPLAHQIEALTQELQSTTSAAVESGLVGFAPAMQSAQAASRPVLDALAPVLAPAAERVDAAAAQWALYGMDGQTQAFVVGSSLLLLEIVREMSTADLEPYPDGKYDSEAARQYFAWRPVEVVARTVELAIRSGGFAMALLSDWLAGPETLRVNGDARALELARVLTMLGPTFIKAGQSASIRTDLLPPPYIRGLTSLQDQVPPFSSDEARTMVEEALGQGPEARALLASLSPTPIAAASLGQVYKGTDGSGRPVAVKVQRPRMSRQIALDMLLIRDVLAPLASLLGLPGDLQGTADAWGTGFVDELDYTAEARNSAYFNANVAKGALNGSVFAPAVVPELSSRRVLTTEWVDGQRLDRTDAQEDVPRLCSLAMSTYLEMMLSDGVLHCDPHPGNLLRTADGRLCILDWGLVTSIEPELQLTLIEHVAHLTAEDYAKVPSDLVKLGFVPPGGEKDIESSGVVEYLTDVYSTWNSGGGAAKLDVPALFARVQDLTAETENGLFQIPPYFAYIAKSFSVLEGIGLSSDPDYSIVKETLPYISRRIMTDPSPRTAGALETFVFGDIKDDRDARVLSPKRVETLLKGAQKYAATTAAAVAGPGAELTPAGAPLDVAAAADALLDVLERDSPLQELVVEQLTLVLAAGSRELWARARASSPRVGGDGRSLLGLVVDPFGIFRNSRIIENNDRDRKALEAAGRLVEMAASMVGTAPASGLTPDGRSAANAEAAALARALVRKAWDRRQSIPAIGRLFLLEALDQTYHRLSGRQ